MNNYKIWHPFSKENQVNEKIKIIKGKNEYLYDEKGNKYLDLISSWWTNIHGHCNKRIQNAIKKQLNQLDHVIFTHFTHNSAIDLSEKLYRLLEGNFDKFFFSDNGSTSVEVAIKIAHQYWKNKGYKDKNIVIAFEGGYHGDTFGAMSVGKNSGFFKNFEDKCFEVHFAKYSEIQDNLDIDKNDKECLLELEDFMRKNINKISFLIIEPFIQGASGMRFSSKKFNQKILDLCKKYNIISVFDEVMTGFGRTGKHFAFQHLDSSPDIICLSKGITGGFLPLGVTGVKDFLYKEFISDNSDKIFLHGHSYTANPIICSAANECLSIFLENKTLNKIEKIEKVYKKFYQDNKHNAEIKNIRFMGDVLAFDFISKDFNRDKFIESCHKKGLILRPLTETLYFIPPYCIKLKKLKEAIKKSINITRLYTSQNQYL